MHVPDKYELLGLLTKVKRALCASDLGLTNLDDVPDLKCDCKYGATDVGRGHEAGNGCPEVAAAIRIIQQISDAEYQALIRRDSFGAASPPQAKTGAEVIAAERKRQIESEGWTAEHDDGYTSGQLTWAAACYALVASWRRRRMPDGYYKQWWPWSSEWWKPTPGDRIRELAKAGALIAAEIDRINRLVAKAS